MAHVEYSGFIDTIRGKFGPSVVFKDYGGKTIITHRAKPSLSQSNQQKANRSKFREATAFAKEAMLDPARKEYYWKKAKELKLPNAYTAAITDYMRNPEVHTFSTEGDAISVKAIKKGFSVKQAEVVTKTARGTYIVQSGRATQGSPRLLAYPGELLRVTDHTNRVWLLPIT